MTAQVRPRPPARAGFTGRRSTAAGLGAALLLAAPASSFAAPRLLVHDATILTLAADQSAPIQGYLLVADDGRIAAVEAGEPPAGLGAAETIDARGRIVLPGFISAHSHLWQSALRGLGADQYVRGWGLAVRVYSMHATDEDLYWFTLHGALDHLQHGITSAFNFGYGHRAGDYNDEQLRALADSGIRYVHAWAQSRDVPVAERARQFREYHAFAQAYAGTPQFLRLGLTGGATSLEEVRFDRQLMEEYGALNQAHFLEWPLQKETQQAAFAHFVEAGTLGPDQFFGHFIHTTDEMLRATAAAGAGMSWNPLSNGRLASGIPDIPRYLELGVNVGMGVDGQASADLPDPFENLRAGLYFLRASREDAQIMQPVDILRLHTLGSATVMGVADKVGTLEVGKYADFLLVAPQAGLDRAPVFDPFATVVFACNTANVEAVYVGGERLVAGRAFTRADPARASAEVARRVERLRPPQPAP